MSKNNHTLTLAPDKDIYGHLEYQDRIENGILGTYIGARQFRDYSAGASMNGYIMQSKSGIYINCQEIGWKVKIDIILEP